MVGCANVFNVASAAPDTSNCGSFNTSSAGTGNLVWRNWQVPTFSVESYYTFGIRIACKSMGTAYLTFEYSVNSGVGWNSLITSVGGSNLAATTLTRSLAANFGASSVWIRMNQTNAHSRGRAQLWDIFLVTSVHEDHARYPADDLGMTDSIFDVMAFNRYSADNLGFTDALLGVRGINRYISDELGIADAVWYVLTAGGTAYERFIGESIGVTDSLYRVASYLRAVGDSAGISDSMGRYVVFARRTADSLGITDSAMRAQVSRRYQGDTVGITDTVTRAAAIVRRIADQVGITDFSQRYMAISRIVADAVGISDPMVDSEGFVRALAEQLGITDATSYVLQAGAGGVAHVRLIADSLGITDSFSFTILLNIWLTLATGIMTSRQDPVEIPGPTMEIGVGNADVIIEPGPQAWIDLGVK